MITSVPQKRSPTKLFTWKYQPLLGEQTLWFGQLEKVEIVLNNSLVTVRDFQIFFSYLHSILI